MLIFAAPTTFTIDPFDALPTTGEFHTITPDGANVIVGVAWPSSFKAANAYLTNLGATVAPPLSNPTTGVGTTFAGLLPTAWGVLSTDITYAAAEKILTATGWSMIDPEDE